MRTYLATWDRGAVRFTSAATGGRLAAEAQAQVRLIDPTGVVRKMRDVTAELRQDPRRRAA